MKTKFILRSLMEVALALCGLVLIVTTVIHFDQVTYYLANNIQILIRTMGFWNTIGLIIAIIAVVVSFTWFTFESAKNNTWATHVAQEEFKFVAKGESLLKTLHNLVDAGLDKDGKVTTVKEDMVALYRNPIFWLLKEMLGIYWVSILFPTRHVFSFKIDKNRLRQESQLPKEHTIKDLVEVEKEVLVDSLRRFFPRPLFIPEVELADGLFVNMVVMSEYEVTRPYEPVFKYKGNFFPLLDAPTEGAVNDFGSTIKYEDLLKTKRGKGSPFSDTIIKMIGKSVEETVGIRIKACYIVQFGLPLGEPEVIAATQAKEIKHLEGEGIKALTDAETYRIREIAKAQADSYSRPIEAMTKLRVTPDVAAMQVGRRLSLSEVSGKDSKMTVFVEGGSESKTGINITP